MMRYLFITNELSKSRPDFRHYNVRVKDLDKLNFVTLAYVGMVLGTS